MALNTFMAEGAAVRVQTNKNWDFKKGYTITLFL